MERKEAIELAKTFPSYRSHKVVAAAEIVKIDTSAVVLRGLGHGVFRMTVKVGEEEREIEFSSDWYRRHDNVDFENAMLVIYEDGYMSVSPKVAFEDGYTLVSASDHFAASKTCEFERPELAFTNLVKSVMDGTVDSVSISGLSCLQGTGFQRNIEDSILAMAEEIQQRRNKNQSQEIEVVGLGDPLLAVRAQIDQIGDPVLRKAMHGILTFASTIGQARFMS